MKLFSVKRIFLAAAVFTPGMMGSVEWSNRDAPSVRFINGDFTVTTSTASAGEAHRVVRRAPCALVRYYVAKYSAPAAEAWRWRKLRAFSRFPQTSIEHQARERLRDLS